MAPENENSANKKEIRDAAVLKLTNSSATKRRGANPLQRVPVPKHRRFGSSHTSRKKISKVRRFLSSKVFWERYVPIIGILIGLAALGGWTLHDYFEDSDAVKECDRLAGERFDPAFRGAGVPILDHNRVAEIAQVCFAARHERPNDLRLADQWARAIECDGRAKDALAEFDRLAKLGYWPAAARAAELSLIMRRPDSQLQKYIDQVLVADTSRAEYIVATKEILQQSSEPAANSIRKYLLEETCQQ